MSLHDQLNAKIETESLISVNVEVVRGETEEVMCESCKNTEKID